MLNIDKLKYYHNMCIDILFINYFVGATISGNTGRIISFDKFGFFAYTINDTNHIGYSPTSLMQIFDIPMNKKDIKTLEMLTHRFIDHNLTVLI